METAMKVNIGTTDRLIRVIAGLILVVLFFVLEGGARYIGLLGVVLLATSALNFCPIYAILGMSTRPKSETSRG
jgi:hypothetical protein